MRWLVIATGVWFGCGATPPASPSGSGSQASSSGSATTAAPRPYSGAPERGPCHDAHDCKLRDNCGCSCDAVLISAPTAVACDESCPDHDVCKGHSLICDLATQTCGAIPPPPKR